MGSLSLIFLVLIFSLLIICLWLFYRFIVKFQTRKAADINGNNLQLPPGRIGWPFVGESLDYLYRNINGVPEKFVEERRKMYSPKVFKTSLMGEPMAVLNGAEGNKFLFSNENKLVRVWFPPIIDKLFPKYNNKSVNDDAIRMRRMMSSFFKADALRKSVGVMDSVMKQHMVSDWSGDKVVVSSMSKKYASALSSKLILGINEVKIIHEFSRLIEIIATGLLSIPINFPGTPLNKAIKASKTIRKELEKRIMQRRNDIAEKGSSAVQQDMITNMLLSTDENGQFVNEFDIASYLLILMEGGYATVHVVITLIMVYLTDLPQVYDGVLREQMEVADSKEPNELLNSDDLNKMKYTWNVACEVLRLLPPIGAFREAMTDFEYAGYLIPKGWKMHWITRATHKNPEYFQNPEKFDPTRFEGNGPAPDTFIPFGGGTRMCPGNEYAKLVILVFIHNVVTKFKWEKQIPSEKLVHGVLSRPAYGLPIHLRPFKS